MSVYTDGQYLQKHPGWHEEDSRSRPPEIVRAIDRAGIRFSALRRSVAAPAASSEHSRSDTRCQFRRLRNLGRCLQPLPRGSGSPTSVSFSANCQGGPNPSISSCVATRLEHVEDYLGFLRTLRTQDSRGHLQHPLEIHILNVLLRRYDRSRRTYGHLHFSPRRPHSPRCDTPASRSSTRSSRRAESRWLADGIRSYSVCRDACSTPSILGSVAGSSAEAASSR